MSKEKPLKQQQINMSSLKEAILYSRLAYESPNSPKYNTLLNEIKNYSKSQDIVIEAFYKEQDNKTPAEYVANDGSKLIIAYHGTQSLDARKTAIKLNNGAEVSVHSGFATEFNSSNQSREQAIKKVTKTNMPSQVVYTGHSLGGALAPLAAQSDSSKAESTKIILFGAAKYATEDAAIDYNKQGLNSCTLRIEQDLDPVTALPPAFLGYVHVGHNIEVPIELSTSIHLLENGYSELISAKHQQKTYDQLIKLDLTKIVSAEAYKPYNIDSYKQVVLNMSSSFLKLSSRSLPRAASAFRLANYFVNGGKINNYAPKVNPNLFKTINKPKGFFNS